MLMLRAWNDSVKNKHSGVGFTIVELLVVIVVVGILAAITIVAFRGITTSAREASLKSDLDGAAKQLAFDNINNGYYPATKESANGGKGLPLSSGNAYQYTSNGTTYCLTATNSSTGFYVSSSNNVPISGVCTGHTLSGGNAVTFTWTPRKSSDPSDGWVSVASSSDGAKVAALSMSCVYTSVNNGVDWSGCQKNVIDTRWQSVVMSGDGSKLIINETIDEDRGGGHMYSSIDSGNSWTQRASGNQPNGLLSMSNDGSKTVSSTYNLYNVNTSVWASTDLGANWNEKTAAGSRSWHSVIISKDGTKLIAGEYPGKLYTSSDFGSSWTARGTSNWWNDIAMSNNGSKAVAVVGGTGGNIYTSSDSGATWTLQAGAPAASWNAVASSSDGTKLVAAQYNNGYIYTSTDSGVTWTAQTAAGGRNWAKVAMSADGSKIYAVPSGSGTIFTGVAN
jgi:prepilin-type N-terminal cleavage/methylation domain-containing protein